MENGKKMTSAEFIKKPINVSDLKEQYYGSFRYGFRVEKIAELSEEQFRRFSDELYGYYRFLYDNRDVMYMDPGDWCMHCVLMQEMFNNLSILDAKKFESCFLDFSRWFPGFSDRSRKHDVELQNTEDNYKLAERLKAVSYITSYILKEKEIFDTVTETKIKRKILSCKIKKCSG